MVSFSRRSPASSASAFVPRLLAAFSQQTGFVDVGHHHVRALVKEVARDGQTDAGGGAVTMAVLP